MRTTTIPRGEPVRHCHHCRRPIGPGDQAIHEDGDWLTIWCSEECAYVPLQEPTQKPRQPVTFPVERRQQMALFGRHGLAGQLGLFNEIQ